MPIPEEILPRLWYSSGSGSGLWRSVGGFGTYIPIPYDRLPSLQPTRAPFSWVKELAARDYKNATLATDYNLLDRFTAIETRLQTLGFTLPEEFKLLITFPDLQAQIPSCTACYLDLSDGVFPLPGWPGTCLLRFLDDSQWCLLWYLLFQPGAPVRVLVSHRFLEPDTPDEVDEESAAVVLPFLETDFAKEIDDPRDATAPSHESSNSDQTHDHQSNNEDPLRDCYICAESFGEFIHRFCLENTLWFALTGKLRLTPQEQAYLEAANTVK